MAAHHVDELGGQLIGVPAEPLGIALGQLDNEVVGHQRAALGHDRGSIVELTLQRARDLDRLDLGLEGPGEGAVDHALDAPLEALQDPHRHLLESGVGAPLGSASMVSAQEEAQTHLLPWSVSSPRASGGIGRRAGFRFQCPKGCGGHQPPLAHPRETHDLLRSRPARVPRATAGARNDQAWWRTRRIFEPDVRDSRPCLIVDGQRNQDNDDKWHVGWQGKRVGSGEERDGVPLTHLDEPLFDGSGATKRDLIDYLDAVCDSILPGLEQRPLSVIRVRLGTALFMQKNVPKYTPDWIRTVPVWAEASKREISYALCNDRRTLLWFANQRAVEYTQRWSASTLRTGRRTSCSTWTRPRGGLRHGGGGRAPGTSGAGQRRARWSGEDQRRQGCARVRAGRRADHHRGGRRSQSCTRSPSGAHRPGAGHHRVHP